MFIQQGNSLFKRAFHVVFGITLWSVASVTIWLSERFGPNEPPEHLNKSKECYDSDEQPGLSDNEGIYEQ